MQRPRNRCCGERKHVHIFLQCLDLLFMSHAETLFFIYDQKSQVFILHVFGKEPVCPDDHIHDSFFQAFHRLFLFPGSTESGHHPDGHRIILKALAECIVVLLGKNRCRYQICHLFSVGHSLEGRPDGYFRLSVSHIPADEPVHDFRTFHVPLHVLYGIELVLRFLIRKHFLKLSLPNRIFIIDIPFFGLPDRIQLHQLFGGFTHLAPDPFRGLLPLIPSQLVKPGLLCIGAGVFCDLVQGRGKNKQIVPAFILDADIVLLDVVYGDFFNSPVDSDAVLFMNYIVADGNIREVLYLLAFSLKSGFLPAFFFPSAENIALRDQHPFRLRVFDAAL